MDINLTDIKKQYKKLKPLLDGDGLELSDEDKLRCQDALQLLELRGYIRDMEVDGANLYLQMAEWDGFAGRDDKGIQPSEPPGMDDCHCQCRDWRSYRPDSYDYWRIVLIYLSMRCYDRHKKSIP